MLFSVINVTSGHTQQAVELLGRLQSLASFPALAWGRGKESLVHTVCTCTKFLWYPAYYYFLEADHSIPKVRARKHKTWLSDEIIKCKGRLSKRQEGLLGSRIFIGTWTSVAKFNHLPGVTVKITLMRSQPTLQ